MKKEKTEFIRFCRRCGQIKTMVGRTSKICTECSIPRGSRYKKKQETYVKQFVVKSEGANVCSGRLS